MGKTYVDMEELENMFRQYAIPYTDIFDEIKSVSAEDVAKEMSVHELTCVLENKDEVFAMQVWQKSDIHAALNKYGVDADEERMKKIMYAAKGPLEDCSDNWDKLDDVIHGCILGRTNVI